MYIDVFAITSTRQLEKRLAHSFSIVRPLMESRHHTNKNNIRALFLIEDDRFISHAEESTAISNLRENKSE